MRGAEAFFAVGTDEGRAITWRLWSSAQLGDRFFVSTLAELAEAVVLERAGDEMVVSVRGEHARLKLYRSASAGYYDSHPEEVFPGCDRDLALNGAAAQLYELARFDPQLRLW